MTEDEINKITETIIGCAYKVSNTLGAGFLEKVYENAHAHEVRKMGMEVTQPYGIKVVYDGIVVGDYIADLSTGLPLCLLINFGAPRVQIKRIAGPLLLK